MHNPILTTLSALALGGIAFAQNPDASARAGDGDAAATAAATQLPAACTPLHGQADDGPHAYGLWATGQDYKASFHDGMTFVPYLGADYPHNQPWQWRTTSARIGEHELVQQAPVLLDEKAAMGGSAASLRVEFDLGGIVEAYDVRAEGLEQTFVLAQRTATVGDLVITGAVSTALQTVPCAAAHRDAVYFDATGQAILTYGAAVAVDAHGQRQPMSTAVADGTITLRLDGAWLARACYPVVVDPLLSPVRLSFGTDDATAVDMVFEEQSAQDGLWVAYVRAASATDQDLFVRRATSTGTNSSPVYSDVTTTWSTFEPSCTYVRGTDDFVIAFTREFSSGNRNVRWHRHARSNGSLTTGYGSIAAAAGTHYWRPALGGCRVFTANNDLAALVMQREDTAGAFGNTTSSAIDACILDLSGPGEGTASLMLAVVDSPLTDAERPAIQRTRELSDGHWTIAYQTATTLGFGNTTWDVLARPLAPDLTLQPAVTIDATGTDQRHEFAPRVAGRYPYFVIATVASTQAQQGTRPTGTYGHQVRLTRISWSANTAPPLPTQVLNSNATARVELNDLAHDVVSQSHWGVLYRSNVTENAYFAWVGGNLGTIDSVTIYSAGSGQHTVGGSVAFNRLDESFLTGYGLNGGTFAGEVWIRPYQQPAYTPAWTSGIGCSAGTISWGGEQRAGTTVAGLFLNNLPSGSLAVALVGFAPTSQPLLGVPGVVPGCWLLVPNAGPTHLGVLPLNLGPTAYWPLPLPEWLPAMTLHFQGFHSDAAVSQFFSTQRLEVQVVR